MVWGYTRSGSPDQLLHCVDGITKPNLGGRVLEFQKRLDIVGVCGSIVGVSVPVDFGVASTTSLGFFMSGINFVRYLAAMHACTKTAPGCCKNRWGEDSSLIGCS